MGASERKSFVTELWSVWEWLHRAKHLSKSLYRRPTNKRGLSPGLRGQAGHSCWQTHHGRILIRPQWRAVMQTAQGIAPEWGPPLENGHT